MSTNGTDSCGNWARRPNRGRKGRGGSSMCSALPYCQSDDVINNYSTRRGGTSEDTFQKSVIKATLMHRADGGCVHM